MASLNGKVNQDTQKYLDSLISPSYEQAAAAARAEQEPDEFVKGVWWE